LVPFLILAKFKIASAANGRPDDTPLFDTPAKTALASDNAKRWPLAQLHLTPNIGNPTRFFRLKRFFRAVRAHKNTARRMDANITPS
jgi:hypothetical protein